MRAIVVIQYTLCGISMILTGLFACSLSGLNFGVRSQNDSSITTILNAALFVLIGCCIDIGKYLFWLHRKRNWFFTFNSIALTAFSLAASCAFFITTESQLLEQARVETSEYNSLELRIQGIQYEIEQQKKLLQLRLSSEYHSQWEAGEENSKIIGELQEELANLQIRLREEGTEGASRAVPISNFYIAISNLSGVDHRALRGAGYGILSLLLELSALGVISLNENLRYRNTSTPKVKPKKKAAFNKTKEDKINKLSEDIKNGKVPPVMRAIKSANYGLGTDSIKELLKQLVDEGVLKRDRRNWYQLASKDSAIS